MLLSFLGNSPRQELAPGERNSLVAKASMGLCPKPFWIKSFAEFSNNN
tara:strand:- start:515 stop:658 length:144 start_codon:yes stop_codon:yes gene_type:complete